jgi:hypothetical protein
MVIAPPHLLDESREIPRAERGPGLVFVTVPETKTLKNRLHIDLAPATDDQEAEVRRLESLGARRMDIGQGDARWVVLADPEGNEFCVLTPRDWSRVLSNEPASEPRARNCRCASGLSRFSCQVFALCC